MDRRRFLSAAGATGIALTAGVQSGSASATAPASSTQLQRSLSSVTAENLTIESWDGTKLAATQYTPKGSGPHPAVLMTHGWGAFRQDPLTLPVAKHYAKNGYVVLTYDSRGFAGSEGTVNLNGPEEIKDAQELITWLGNQEEVATEGADNPWVGMDGVSYAGASSSWSPRRTTVSTPWSPESPGVTSSTRWLPTGP